MKIWYLHKILLQLSNSRNLRQVLRIFKYDGLSETIFVAVGSSIRLRWRMGEDGIHNGWVVAALVRICSEFLISLLATGETETVISDSVDWFTTTGENTPNHKLLILNYSILPRVMEYLCSIHKLF